MAAPTEPTELRSRVESALRRIASPSQPQSIQQAQDALLRWEEARADAYAVALASLIGATSSASDADAAAEDPAASAATLRLAAVLALKAAATRRWKDRGRGRAGAPKVLFGEGVKTLIRQTVLNLVLAGKVMDGETGFVNGPDEVTREQAELIQDRALQANAASLVSKIARMDLPLKWQELIPSLVEGVRRAQTTIHQMKQQQAPSREMQHLFQTLLYNTMNALEAVLSEISTQRLLVDKKYRHSVALQHLGSVVENGLIPSYQDMESFRNMGNNIGTEEDVGTLAVKYATVTARVVSHMMLSAFSKLVEDNAALVAKTLEMIHSLIHSFLSVWLRFILDGRHDKGMIDEPMEELLQVHCELIVNTQRSHPVAFVGYLPPFLHLFHSSLMGIAGVPGEETNQGASNADVRCSDRLAVAFLSFLANVVGTSRYEEMEGAKNTLAGFFAPTLVATLSRTLLRLFSLHIRPTRSRNGDDDVDDADDAVLWQDDPEAFYHWELHRSSDEDVGCAAQNLFLALVESSFSGGIILPWLMDLLKYAESQRLAAELDTRMFTGTDAQLVLSALPLGISSAELSRGSRDVAMDLLLQWDSIYTAAGLAGSMLDKCPGFDFRSWFNTSLGDCLALLLRRDKQGVRDQPKSADQIVFFCSLLICILFAIIANPLAHPGTSNNMAVFLQCAPSGSDVSVESFGHAGVCHFGSGRMRSSHGSPSRGRIDTSLRSHAFSTSFHRRTHGSRPISAGQRLRGSRLSIVVPRSSLQPRLHAGSGFSLERSPKRHRRSPVVDLGKCHRSKPAAETKRPRHTLMRRFVGGTRGLRCSVPPGVAYRGPEFRERGERLSRRAGDPDLVGVPPTVAVVRSFVGKALRSRGRAEQGLRASNVSAFA